MEGEDLGSIQKFAATCRDIAVQAVEEASSSNDLSWLDKYIEEQKGNTDLVRRVCVPFSPAEVAELPETEELDFTG